MLEFIRRHQFKILWLGIGAYIIALFSICLWKYYNYYYDNLDLAIFNQVFFNSSYGRFFQFSIHPGFYLGDHFEPFILLLLPFYYLWRSPLTLLFLQTIFLALPAWPIYLIAKQVFNGVKTFDFRLSTFDSLWPLFISFLYLLNPFIHNANLFEFHILPFAIFFLLFSFYFYLRQQYGWLTVFLIISLLVREDVSLVVIMFSLLMLWNYWRENKNFKFQISNFRFKGSSHFLFSCLAGRRAIFYFLFSTFYFLLALKAVSYFNPDGRYKFLIFYDWLGSSLGQLVQNFFLHPIRVLQHVVSYNNIVMFLGVFMPFGFLAILRPKYLLLSLLIAAQILLGSGGGGPIIFQTHYISLFVPALFIALIYSLRAVIVDPLPMFNNYKYFSFLTDKINKIIAFCRQEKKFFITFVLLSTFYSFFIFSPIVGVVNKVKDGDKRALIKKEFIALVPADASLVTTNEFLTPLSLRPKLYSLHYVFIGKTQYDFSDYELSEKPDYILIDFDDLVNYDLHFKNHQLFKKYYSSAFKNLARLLEGYGIVEKKDNIVLFKKDFSSTLALFNIEPKKQNSPVGEIWGEITKIGTDCSIADYPRLNVGLLIGANQKQEKIYQLKLSLSDKQGNVIWSRYIAPAYGFYPTSQWQAWEGIESDYEFLNPEVCLPGFSLSDKKFKVELVDLEGHLELSEIRSLKRVFKNEKVIQTIE